MHFNDRLVSYVEYHSDASWRDHLPHRNWACVLFLDEKEMPCLEEVAAELLQRDVALVCTAGAASEWAHDVLDDEIVIREVEGRYQPPHLVLTTWDQTVEEALWCALFTAGAAGAIEQVVVLDMTLGTVRNRVGTYLHALAAGTIE
jgi:hypothetical protein